MTQPLVMRIMALSINTAKRAGNIIRDVMQKGNLGIVEKVRVESSICCIIYFHYLIIYFITVG